MSDNSTEPRVGRDRVYTKRRVHPTIERIAHDVYEQSRLTIGRVNTLYQQCRCGHIVNFASLGAGPLFSTVMSDRAQSALVRGDTGDLDAQVLRMILSNEVWFPDPDVEATFADRLSEMDTTTHVVDMRNLTTAEVALRDITAEVHHHYEKYPSLPTHSQIIRKGLKQWYRDIPDGKPHFKKVIETARERVDNMSELLRDVPHVVQEDIDLLITNMLAGVPLVVVDHSAHRKSDSEKVVRFLSKQFKTPILYAEVDEDPSTGDLKITAQIVTYSTADPEKIADVDHLSINKRMVVPSRKHLVEMIHRHLIRSLIPAPTKVRVTCRSLKTLTAGPFSVLSEVTQQSTPEPVTDSFSVGMSRAA